MTTFIRDISPILIPNFHGIALSARFSYEQFHHSLFKSFSVTFPPILKKAVNKRCAEFLAGRVIVSKALSQLGHKENLEIKIGENREPIWPHGIIGSITHTKDVACCALSQLTSYRGVGIDLEAYIEDIDAEKYASVIISHIEREIFRRECTNLIFSQWLTLVFSAKESLFKALYPSVQIYFDFLDARISSFDIQQQVLTILILKDLSPDVRKGSLFSVGFRLQRTQVMTFVTI